jgi:hypothetical protein
MQRPPGSLPAVSDHAGLAATPDRASRAMAMITAAVIAAAALATAAPARGADAARLGVDAEYNHYTNVNRAALDGEARSDDSIGVEAHAARSFLLSDRSGIVVRGALKAREFLEFGDLGSLGLAGRVAWRFQPTLGFTSPWIELAAGAEAFKFRDSDIRDGGLANVSASVGRHATDRIRIEGGAGYERRFASEGGVFDLSNARVWGSLDYRLNAAATLYGAATWLKGDQVFTLSNRASWGNLYAQADASAPDPVFASAFGAMPWAYRVGAKTWLFDLGANIALAGNQALDIGASLFDATADQGGGSYDGATFRIAWLYRFR